MQVRENYASAASRHVRDARTLCEASRWDNAGYLAGYAVECGVKAAVELAGVRLRRHLDDIPPKFLVLAADLSLAARRYRLDMDPDVAAAQNMWTTTLRYTETGTLPARDARDLVDGAERVFRRTVVAMVLDGLLERVPQ
jgi:HEPN domain-containing protein